MAPHDFAFVPRTFLDVASLQAHLAREGGAGGRYFFKKSLESRGTGVFPFHSLSEVPHEDLAEPGVFQVRRCTSRSPSSTPALETQSQSEHTRPRGRRASLSASSDPRPTTQPLEKSILRADVFACGCPSCQAEVPRLRLWRNGAKFDLRVLVAACPGPQGTRVFVHPIFYARVAPKAFGTYGLLMIIPKPSPPRGADNPGTTLWTNSRSLARWSPQGRVTAWSVTCTSPTSAKAAPCTCSTTQRTRTGASRRASSPPSRRSCAPCGRTCRLVHDLRSCGG
jgi:hypothetical protein